MLGSFKKKTAEDIKKDLSKRRDAIIVKAASMRKLISIDSGWREYLELLDDYVVCCKKRKAVTSLDIADDATIDQLKKLDHEVWFIENFIKVIPQLSIKKEKDMLDEVKREEEAQTVDNQAGEAGLDGDNLEEL